MTPPSAGPLSESERAQLAHAAETGRSVSHTHVHVAAFDLSLTSTGWATADASGVLEPPKLRGVRRLVWIRDRVLEIARGAELVALEGYAFGVAGQAGVRAIGELGGVVRVALFEAGAPVVEIPPASLKLYATGKGNGPKEAVLAAAIKKLGYAGHSFDVADALFLHRMTAAHYAGADASLTEYERRALEPIAWPRLATPALSTL